MTNVSEISISTFRVNTPLVSLNVPIFLEGIPIVAYSMASPFSFTILFVMLILGWAFVVIRTNSNSNKDDAFFMIRWCFS